ncbi:MAG: class I SAM-dependent methyltransferase, partial [Chitinophagales bacterium]
MTNYSIFFSSEYLIKRNIYKEVKSIADRFTGVVLDFGCGSKPYESLFLKNTTYIGLDFPSDRFLGHKSVTDIEYDGKKINLENNSINNCVCTEVFEHVFDIDIVLSEIGRVLRPDGELFITCPFSLGEHEAPYDFARYTSYGLTTILKRHNFEIIYFKKSGMDVTAIIQLLNIFLNNYISRIPFLKYVLLLVTIFPLNCLGILSQQRILK